MIIDFSPRGIATIVFKNLLIISTIVFLAVAAALVYFFIATNVYQARATLLVRFGSDVRPELQLDAPQIPLPSSRDERRELIESYMRILQSRDYSTRLVQEFGVAALYPSLLAGPPPPFGTVEDEAARRLRDGIVAKSGTQTNVIELSFFHRDRDLAIRLLDRLIDMYITTQAELYENPQIDFTKTQMDAALEQLKKLQDELNALRKSTGIFEFDKQFELLLTQQNTILDNISSLQSRSAEAQGRQQRLEAVLGTVPQNVATIVDEKQYKALEDLGRELNELRAKNRSAAAGSPARQALADMERQYQQKLREIQALNRGGSSDLYQTMLADYLRSTADAEAARSAIDYWTGELNDVSARISKMQNDNQAIVDTNREVELAETTYRALKRQYEDASVSQRLNDERITRVSMIDAPYSDPRPARPRKFLMLAAALVGSVLAAAALVVLKEGLSDRVYLPDHIERALGLKVITSFKRFERKLLTT